MKVYLNSITGLEDAMVSLLMSKRNWTLEKAAHLAALVRGNTIENGEPLTPQKLDPEFIEQMDKLIKYGIIQGHTTLLRYIDLSFTVVGLHRAAQDDFDSHARRLDNRIIRSSTRLGHFHNNEKSDYYKDKIMFPFEVAEILGIKFPEELPTAKGTYVKTDYGYIRKELKGNQDVERGLYPLCIPSNFIFKVQYPELCHIVQHRDKDSHANPELKEAIEQMKKLVTDWYPWLGENLNILQMEPGPSHR